MNYSAEIKAFGNPEEIARCFEPEIEKKDRSCFNIKKEKDHVLITVEAKDSIALRATLNSITKLFTAYEKLDKI